MGRGQFDGVGEYCGPCSASSVFLISIFLVICEGLSFNIGKNVYLNETFYSQFSNICQYFFKPTTA